MKKRFATKLILSAAAVAVSAATLVSTTYAWYVQNSTVTATGVSGSAKAKDESSIFISDDFILASNTATWGPTSAFAAADVLDQYDANSKEYNKDITIAASLASTAAGNKVFNGGLDPITYGSYTVEQTPTSGFVFPNNAPKKNGKDTTNHANYDVLASDRVITFNLYVQTNVANTAVTPTIIIDNTTDAEKRTGQTVYSNINYDKNAQTEGVQQITQGDSIWVDAVQALRMQMDVSKFTPGENSNPNTFAPLATTYYDVLDIAKSENNQGTIIDYVLETSSVANVITIVETGLQEETVDYKKYDRTNGTYADATGAAKTLKGAHAYYAKMVGAEPQATFTDNSERTYLDTISPVTLSDAGTAYKFTFTFWLEGTDISCFDCCANQEFSIKVVFNSAQ